MLTLALGTSGELCSVAIRDGQGTLVERIFRHRMHLSERLVGDVEAVLADAGATLAGIDALAVDIGPGSFTGLRIGVMTVKTWADVLDKPVAGITALDALAAEQPVYEGATVLAVIRARPGTVYARAFAMQTESLTALTDAAVLAPAELPPLLGEAPVICTVCGDGLARHGVEIASALREAGHTVALGSADAPRASTVARLAAVRVAAGLRDDPLTLSPLYIAPPPIGPQASR